ncbi:hypothetical protein [Muricoccus nepalensis]|uniref:hypothetical protein n=1 Tax=Muricoccus nepalensis TaxID=1854500 RepID=UPI001F4F8A50|nr:hypothetical protein [Roseomonas nepalensis]
MAVSSTSYSALSAELSSWRELPPEVQLLLAQGAMQKAAALLAEHAELLAGEMDAGVLLDEGGPEALRLFAAAVRATNGDGWVTVGNA